MSCVNGKFKFRIKLTERIDEKSVNTGLVHSKKCLIFISTIILESLFEHKYSQNNDLEPNLLDI